MISVIFPPVLTIRRSDVGSYDWRIFFSICLSGHPSVPVSISSASFLNYYLSQNDPFKKWLTKYRYFLVGFKPQYKTKTSHYKISNQKSSSNRFVRETRIRNPTWQPEYFCIPVRQTLFCNPIDEFSPFIECRF